MDITWNMLIRRTDLLIYMQIQVLMLIKRSKMCIVVAKQLTISDKAIEDIILYYTRESASVVWNAVWAISAERQHA